jgi:peptidoglycan/LPS O-acetylase OafA/YrhL
VKIEKIDFVRGLGIIAVFFFHVIIVAFPEIHQIKYEHNFLAVQEYSALRLLSFFNPISYGHSGVQLFLVISGFLIHLNHIKKGKPLVYVKFINRRFWRIYPPYLLALIAFGCFFFEGTKDFILHIFLLHNVSSYHAYTINPSFWSLALEFQLYLIYPLYLFLNRKLGVKKTLGLAWLVAILFIAIGITFHINDQTYNNFLFKNWVIWITGAYLAECYVKNIRLYKGSWLGLIAILVCVMAFKYVEIYHHLNVYLFTIFYTLFLDKLLNTDVKLSALSKSLVKATSFIGVISYSFYLVHQPFLPVMMHYFSFNVNGIAGDALGSVFTFTLLIGVSYLFFRLIENPSVAIGRKIEAKLKTAFL